MTLAMHQLWALLRVLFARLPGVGTQLTSTLLPSGHQLVRLTDASGDLVVITVAQRTVPAAAPQLTIDDAMRRRTAPEGAVHAVLAARRHDPRDYPTPAPAVEAVALPKAPKAKAPKAKRGATLTDADVEGAKTAIRAVVASAPTCTIDPTSHVAKAIHALHTGEEAPEVRVWMPEAQWDALTEEQRAELGEPIGGVGVDWEGREGWVTALVPDDEVLVTLQGQAEAFLVVLSIGDTQPVVTTPDADDTGEHQAPASATSEATPGFNFGDRVVALLSGEDYEEGTIDGFDGSGLVFYEAAVVVRWKSDNATSGFSREAFNAHRDGAWDLSEAKALRKRPVDKAKPIRFWMKATVYKALSLERSRGIEEPCHGVRVEWEEDGSWMTAHVNPADAPDLRAMLVGIEHTEGGAFPPEPPQGPTMVLRVARSAWHAHRMGLYDAAGLLLKGQWQPLEDERVAKTDDSELVEGVRRYCAAKGIAVRINPLPAPDASADALASEYREFLCLVRGEGDEWRIAVFRHQCKSVHQWRWRVATELRDYDEVRVYGNVGEALFAQSKRMNHAGRISVVDNDAKPACLRGHAALVVNGELTERKHETDAVWLAVVRQAIERMEDGSFARLYGEDGVCVWDSHDGGKP